jgi:hypothetical protein
MRRRRGAGQLVSEENLRLAAWIAIHDGRLLDGEDLRPRRPSPGDLAVPSFGPKTAEQRESLTGKQWRDQ